MFQSILELMWPIFGAVAAGTFIGAEREFRGSPAGLRTHILVSLSCCLLTLCFVHQIDWMDKIDAATVRIDPVRMAHGIMTGIGFLCGGVIFREGFNVHGLTTAASLWMTASLGILFGINFYELAIFGTVITVIILSAVTITDKWQPRQRMANISISYRLKDALSAASISDEVALQGLSFISLDQKMENGLATFTGNAVGYTEEKGDILFHFLASRPDIEAFEIRPK